MRRRLPPLNALRAFEATARHANLSAAANELCVTSGAVSRQVRQLEVHFGSPLFHRTPKGLVLTDAGANYLPFVRRAFDLFESGDRRLREGAIRRTIVVATLPSFAAKWLVPRLKNFRRNHPDCDLRLVTSETLIDLVDAGVDFAIRYGQGGWPGLDDTLLFRESIFPVCAPSLAAALHAPADLVRLPLLHPDHERMAETWKDWFARAGCDGQPSGAGLRFSDAVAMIQAAIDGQGVALGRSALVADDIGAGRLAAPFEVALPARYAYHLIWPRGAPAAADALAFQRWVIAEAEAFKTHAWT